MTPNKEDYLKCIHELGESNQKISNKDIAKKMAVSAPAVSEMIKKLISEELLFKDKKAGYLLSFEGKKRVSDIYRKHRLLEVFLINHLNYSAEEIHEEAEILEHTVSDLFIQRLDILLGFPELCPHGGTIPPNGQLLEEKYQLTLDKIREIGTYQLVRFHDNFQLLHYMAQHNLTIGDKLTVVEYDDFAKAFHIEFNHQSIQITDAVASQLFVQKVF